MRSRPKSTATTSSSSMSLATTIRSSQPISRNFAPRNSNTATPPGRRALRKRSAEKRRSGGPRQAGEAGANKARQFETVGSTGTFSCSPVGPGGYTGCLTQVINQARRERNEQADQTTAPEQ